MDRSSIFSADLTPPAPAPLVTQEAAEKSSSKTMYIASAVILMAVGGIIAASDRGMKDTWGQVSIFFGLGAPDVTWTDVTVQPHGDLLSAQVKTDDTPLGDFCGQVMQEVYVLAERNSWAHRLELTVQVAGGKEASIEVADLEMVRHFHTKIAYASSEHRSFVGEPLVTAGIVSEASLAAPASYDGDTDVVGNYYESGPEVTPRLSLKFINDSQVELYAGGVSTGTCSYTIQGDHIVIPTSCSTMLIHKKGTDLIYEGLNCQLTRQ